MSRYELFDRSRITLRSIEDRNHDLLVRDCLPLEPPSRPYMHPELPEVVERILRARQNGRPVILMMGAHPIKLGLSRYLVDLIDRGIVTHLATNGAGMIHDYELAVFGGTSENVARWIKAGQFGLWQETGHLNDLIAEAARRGEGLGEAIGRYLQEAEVPHREISLAAAGYRKGVPVTCHVGVGSDILHAHANCDGAALGQASYTDFLIFARSVEDLEGGMLLNVGSAVTGPEVFLKALSMARNVGAVRHFTTAVFDLAPLPDDFRDGLPCKDHPLYYYRPWKSLLIRTLDGGVSYYFCGDHRRTIPTLWAELLRSW